MGVKEAFEGGSLVTNVEEGITHRSANIHWCLYSSAKYRVLLEEVQAAWLSWPP